MHHWKMLMALLNTLQKIFDFALNWMRPTRKLKDFELVWKLLNLIFLSLGLLATSHNGPQTTI